MAGLLSWSPDGLPAARSAQFKSNARSVTSTSPQAPSRAAGSCILDTAVIILTLAPFFVVNPAVVRLIRVVRIVSLAKLGRTSRALGHLFDALKSRKDELVVTGALAAVVVLLGATALYWAEGAVQPDKFRSIPRSIWWAVVTLTTIGYGDAFPITPLSKVLAAMVAVAGIALIAMPTGILAASFSDALARDRARAESDKGPSAD